MTANELLEYARSEWSFETMNWFSNIHFGEDFCLAAVQNTQENLNIMRKIVLNSLKSFKAVNNLKTVIFGLMLDCMMDPKQILRFYDKTKFP